MTILFTSRLNTCHYLVRYRSDLFTDAVVLGQKPNTSNLALSSYIT